MKTQSSARKFPHHRAAAAAAVALRSRAINNRSTGGCVVKTISVAFSYAEAV